MVRCNSSASCVREFLGCCAASSGQIRAVLEPFRHRERATLAGRRASDRRRVQRASTPRWLCHVSVVALTLRESASRQSIRVAMAGLGRTHDRMRRRDGRGACCQARVASLRYPQMQMSLPEPSSPLRPTCRRKRLEPRNRCPPRRHLQRGNRCCEDSSPAVRNRPHLPRQLTTSAARVAAVQEHAHGQSY